ncbi:MAG: aspartate kinase [Defluviitaleaceae bacterium]|nr:aspartate kinase [Defluviitaleaceae bacterium]
MRVVSKFGGSSVSCGVQFKKVKQLVEADTRRQIIIVSALGKRQPSDHKLTDLFYSVCENVSQSTYYEGLWQEISMRFLAIKHELNLVYDVEKELNHIRAGVAAQMLTVDEVVSRGEYLTARLMSEYLGYDFCDAKQLILFKETGEIDLDGCLQRIAKTLPKDAHVVIPGFYGADEDGTIKLFSRGGSDITGAIVAAGVKAHAYENFTDVSGVLMVDPRLIENPLAIPELTYEEMSYMADMGAHVLHRQSVDPAKSAGIPIHIKNTNDPLAPGTLIHHETSEAAPQLIGFFGKKDYTFFTLYKQGAFSEKGLIRHVLAIFERYDIHVEQVTTGLDYVGFLVPSVDVKYCPPTLFDLLKVQLEVEEIERLEGFSLIGIFGRNTVRESGFLGLAFFMLSSAKIQTLLLQQSARGPAWMIGVATEDYEKTMKVLYEGFSDDKGLVGVGGTDDEVT